MKVHKFVVYAFDHEGHGQEEIEFSLDQCGIHTIFFEGSADIGEWDDDHELNTSGCDQLTFDKYLWVKP
jgi:hypothetical protein